MTLVLFVIALVIFNKRFIKVPFEPKLIWKPVDVVIDFNQMADTPVFVGKIVIENLGQAHPIGRWANAAHPNREGTYELPENANTSLPDLGFKPRNKFGGQLFGFPVGDKGNNQAQDDEGVCFKYGASVTHQSEVLIFFDVRQVLDFTSELDPLPSDGEDVSLKFDISLNWKKGNLDNESSVCKTDNEVIVRLLPERKRPPTINFTPALDDLHYRENALLTIGSYEFRSGNNKNFALPFQGKYGLIGDRDGILLRDTSFILATPEVTIPAGGSETVNVRMECDGQSITNPYPERQDYKFRLQGEMDGKSRPGPHTIELLRDREEANLVLQVHQKDCQWEVFRKGEKGPLSFKTIKGVADAPEPNLKGQMQLYLPFPATASFVSGTHVPTSKVLTFSLRNSGISGDGFVEVLIEPRIEFTELQDSVIDFKGNSGSLDLIHFKQGGRLVSRSELKFKVSREDEITLETVLNLACIDQVYGGYIAPLDCTVHLAFKVKRFKTKNDLMPFDENEADVSHGLEIIQKGNSNWLALDFGTSAISAALGSTKGDVALNIVDFQKIVVEGEETSYSTEDKDNQEAGTPFLPSWVIYDSDIREKESTKTYPEGYPYSKDVSMVPGDIGFLGVPALSVSLKENSQRVIFSLKSWLGEPGDDILLKTNVEFMRDGKLEPGQAIPKEETLESGLAALANAYLTKDPNMMARQVILSYPNTFTPIHLDRFRKVAINALTNPLKINDPDNHLEFIRESDAIAHYFVRRRLPVRGKEERILVYDLGAGTLDLSLIRIKWGTENRPTPRQWCVEARVGVPLAGNYLDELIARLIHKKLMTDLPEELDYKIKVVTDEVYSASETEHYLALLDLWHEIRKAKHHWKKSDTPMTVVVGYLNRPAIVRRGTKGVDRDQFNKKYAGNWSYDKDGNFHMTLKPEEIKEHMKEFIDFITQQIPRELLLQGRLNRNNHPDEKDVSLSKSMTITELLDDVDGFLPVGRGSLFPLIERNLEQIFSNSMLDDIHMEAQLRKEAVVRGALRRQVMRKHLKERDITNPRILVLSEATEEFEELGEQPQSISIIGVPELRIVQVCLFEPKPEDLTTYRKKLYIDLCPPIDTLIYDQFESITISKVTDGDSFRIVILEHEQEGYHGDGVATVSTLPPWPIGRTTLSPLDDRIDI
jgi:hypothetical protein